MTKTGLNEYVYDFSADYDAIAVAIAYIRHSEVFNEKE